MPQKDPVSMIQNFFEYALELVRYQEDFERRVIHTEMLLHALDTRFTRSESMRVVTQRADELRFIALMRRIRVLEGQNLQETDMESIPEAGETDSVDEEEGADKLPHEEGGPSRRGRGSSSEEGDSEAVIEGGPIKEGGNEGGIEGGNEGGNGGANEEGTVEKVPKMEDLKLGEPESP